MTLQFPAVVFDDNGAPKYSYDRARATSSVLACVNIMPSLKDKTLVSDSDLQELGYHIHTHPRSKFSYLYNDQNGQLCLYCELVVSNFFLFLILSGRRGILRP